MVQWAANGTAGKMNLVSPIDQADSKKTRIPTWMYSLSDWDLNYDGIVDFRDINPTARAFGATWGSERWNIECDVNMDGIVDFRDINPIARHFGEAAPEWPLP
jgi:hypothetical protein